MMIHEITPHVGAHKKRKRIGRGPGSGTGKTAGRGHKGAGSRAGWSGSQNGNFEGGQTPYFRRIPKRGFSNAQFRKHFSIVNIGLIDGAFADDSEVTPESLKEKGIINDVRKPVKILGEGELTKKLTVSAAKFSASAKEKIEKSGGTCTVIG